jgi:hypothetical protein
MSVNASPLERGLPGSHRVDHHAEGLDDEAEGLVEVRRTWSLALSGGRLRQLSELEISTATNGRWLVISDRRVPNSPPTRRLPVTSLGSPGSAGRMTCASRARITVISSPVSAARAVLMLTTILHPVGSQQSAQQASGRFSLR